MRRWLTVTHRYVGLVLAGFLVLAGTTGAVLPWYHELDAAINPGMMRAAPPDSGAVPVDPLQVREELAKRFPHASLNWVDLSPLAGKARLYHMTLPETAGRQSEGDDEAYVDPFTGELLGTRRWGDISEGLTNVMPFLYRLHFSLALDSAGATLFGIIALLWTLDCFVGASLTLPAGRRLIGSATISGKSWFARWRPALAVRWGAGLYRFNVDLHRAGGLWPWAMLFVFAWSSVGFNLQTVYRPVMTTLFAYQDELDQHPVPSAPQPVPGLPWVDAREIGRRLMMEEARQQGFTIHEERGLSYDPQRAIFRYRVQSDRDLGERWGVTSVYFDANDGRRVAARIPTGKAAGDTISNWLFALHMAAVGGIPFRVFVSVLGLGVAMLSVTGVVIWRKKQRGRRVAASRLQAWPGQTSDRKQH